jgi:hypothetical protein
VSFKKIPELELDAVAGLFAARKFQAAIGWRLTFRLPFWLLL